jgi:hypothetical protein
VNIQIIEMIKFYTDSSVLTENHRRYVFPICLDIFYKKNSEILEVYAEVGDISDADVIILPLEYNYLMSIDPNIFATLRKQSIELNIPLWVYTGGDIGYSFKAQDIINFRVSGFHSKLNNNTVIMPSFIVDPYLSYKLNNFKSCVKKEQPDIGFVGHANKSSIGVVKDYMSFLKRVLKSKLAKRRVDSTSFYASPRERYKCLKQLQEEVGIKTNFILRAKYRAGAASKMNRITSEQEFFNNMFNNSYTFCLRGVGNFSVRFYECLAMGRIPILLDTDCRLPLNSIIDWEKHAVIVNTGNLVESLMTFHNKTAPTDFKNIQISNRKLYSEKLNRIPFFIEISKHFKAS